MSAPLGLKAWAPKTVRKVLLIEDEVDIRENTPYMIELLGYDVVTGGTAEGAIWQVVSAR